MLLRIFAIHFSLHHLSFDRIYPPLASFVTPVLTL
jgi:hypothetical protein